MMNSADLDKMPLCGSDFSGMKAKAGKDKRLSTKQERKQVKTLRMMRKNRHSL